MNSMTQDVVVDNNNTVTPTPLYEAPASDSWNITTRWIRLPASSIDNVDIIFEDVSDAALFKMLPSAKVRVTFTLPYELDKSRLSAIINRDNSGKEYTILLGYAVDADITELPFTTKCPEKFCIIVPIVMDPPKKKHSSRSEFRCTVKVDGINPSTKKPCTWKAQFDIGQKVDCVSSGFSWSQFANMMQRFGERCDKLGAACENFGKKWEQFGKDCEQEFTKAWRKSVVVLPPNGTPSPSQNL